MVSGWKVVWVLVFPRGPMVSHNITRSSQRLSHKYFDEFQVETNVLKHVYIYLVEDTVLMRIRPT